MTTEQIKQILQAFITNNGYVSEYPVNLDDAAAKVKNEINTALVNEMRIDTTDVICNF